MRRLCLLIAVVVLTGCVKQSEITRYTEPKLKSVAETPSAPAVVASSEATAAPGDSPYSWTTPEGWEITPASGMRLFTFTAALDGESNDGSLIQLGGAAGGLLANINRWRGQVGLASYDQAALEADRELRDAGDVEYGYFKIVGEEQAILAGVFSFDDATLFVKMTTSPRGADLAVDGFTAFCDSIRRN